MKNKKNHLSLVCVLFVTLTKAQLATTDPGQTAQNAIMIGQNTSILSQAVQTFQEIQKTVVQGEQSYAEFIQMKTYMSNVEDRLQNVGDIKQLKLNNLDALLSKVLCIKEGNYFPKAIRFTDIILKMQAAFLNCNNQDLYNQTYSGVLDNFDLKVQAAGNVGAQELNSRLNDLNASLCGAQTTNQATNAYNARMKLELGLKYKSISDTLVYESAELHRAINEDKGSNGNVSLTSAERMQLMALANQYQLEALDYEQKSAELLKEASEADEQQKAQIISIERDIANKQMINFHL